MKSLSGKKKNGTENKAGGRCTDAPALSAKELAEGLYSILVPLWPDARPLLHYGSDFELLVSVILSAQCTDEQVNRVTPALFRRWPDAAAMAGATQKQMEDMIHSVGFFRTKAQHLREMSRILVDDFGGRVPLCMDKLLELPGVGRKTANLVYSACSGGPGIIVDTHVARVCRRTGLCENDDPGLCEKRIAAALPEAEWTAFSHAVNRHGKFVCRARNPACTAGGECPVFKLCARKGLKGKAAPD